MIVKCQSYNRKRKNNNSYYNKKTGLVEFNLFKKKVL